jgi:hypothetical protein
MHLRWERKDRTLYARMKSQRGYETWLFDFRLFQSKTTGFDISEDDFDLKTLQVKKASLQTRREL